MRVIEHPTLSALNTALAALTTESLVGPITVIPPQNGSPFDRFLATLSTDVAPQLLTPAGAGITSGSGGFYQNSVDPRGGITKTTFLLDLTGLASSTTLNDIIGVGASAAHLGQVTSAQCGVFTAGRVTCLEAPAGGVADIDFYTADEGTGVFDGLVTSLTETALVTAAESWTLGMVKVMTALPADGDYLYLACGNSGTAATYTAGKFLIELFGDPV